MALSGEVHHDVRFLAFEDFINRLTVANIRFEEFVIWVFQLFLDSGGIRGIGADVDVKDIIFGSFF